MMTPKAPENRIVVTSLPRSGSTSLARLLNCHPGVNVIIEPFHPRRFGGVFHQLVKDQGSLQEVLQFLWSHWNCIKHVWEADEWPFRGHPELNNDVIAAPGTKVILIIRRNELRRVVSNLICRQTKFWIGRRDEFLKHLRAVNLAELEPGAIRKQIEQDRLAIDRRIQSLRKRNTALLLTYYEDLFRDDHTSESRLEAINEILAFTGRTPLSHDQFQNGWNEGFDPAVYRWTTSDIYELIPGIQEIEQEVGCAETGWLFK